MKKFSTFLSILMGLLITLSAKADINDIVLNELLFNPGDLSPNTNVGQDCNGDGLFGYDGSSPPAADAEDEFIEFYNNGLTNVDLSGYCISNNDVSSSTPSSINRWLIPSGVIVPAGGFYYICGADDGRGFGFSLADANSDEVQQFSNGTNSNTWASLYEPVTSNNCGSGVQAIIFNEDYGSGESNGEPYLRCFTDGTSPLGFYLNGNGDFSVPSPGVANCTVSTPVHVNYIVHKLTTINWESSLEFNHLGYNVYAIDGENKTKLNTQLIKSNKSHQYTFPINKAHQNLMILLTAVDVQGIEEKLERIKPYQKFGSKEKAILINWNKSTQESEVQNRAENTHINSVHVLVDQTGIQTIKVQDLLDLGFDIIGLKKRNIKMTLSGLSVPFYINQNSRIISKNDDIIFLAHKAESIYSNQNIYKISIAENNHFIRSVNASPRRNIRFVSYFMATETIEDNIDYEISSQTNDPWIMKSMLTTGKANSASWEVDLPYLANGNSALHQPIDFNAYLNGVTDFVGPQDDHHMVFQVNNQSVSQYFDGLTSTIITNEVPNTSTSNHFNITLTQPADTGFDYDLVNLDKFVVHYPRSFVADNGRIDFQSSKKQYKINGFTNRNIIVLSENNSGIKQLKRTRIKQNETGFEIKFLNPFEQSHIHVAQMDSVFRPTLLVQESPPFDSTDYLIITHSMFVPYLEDYVLQKKAIGLNVSVVDASSIYTHYGNTNHNPDSIKSYINAINNIYPLSYVMIVGSDHYDYKNYLDSAALSIVPTFYRDTGDGVAHAPTDAPFVDYNNDGVSDIAIGRLPVNNTEELENILLKISQYQPNNFMQETFITDNVDANNFSEIAEHLSLYSQANIDIIYSEQVGVIQANIDLIDKINAGTDFVNWIGHSSSSRWSRDNIFDIEDVNTMSNPPTVFFQLGCWNSYFVDPLKQSLAGALIQKQHHGATATIGSSTYTKTDGEKLLAQYFKEFINQNNSVTIGQAFNYALNKYALVNPDRKDILLGYQLLGDPTLLVKY